MRIRCEKLSYDTLRTLAGSFLDKYHPSGEIPVPIEDIIDLCLAMNIVPVREFQRHYGIVGALGADFTTIYVDEYVQEYRRARYHFTLAHELAHRELHRAILEQVELDGVEDWLQINGQIDDNTHDWMEWQAYSWAGLVLVPASRLAEHFERELTRAKEASFYVEGSPDLAREYISEALSRPFAVSPEVIYKRIGRDNLL